MIDIKRDITFFQIELFTQEKKAKLHPEVFWKLVKK